LRESKTPQRELAGRPLNDYLRLNNPIANIEISEDSEAEIFLKHDEVTVFQTGRFTSHTNFQPFNLKNGGGTFDMIHHIL